MRKIYLLISILLTIQLSAQSNIAFSVDMTGETFTQAYVSGSFNGWSGTANPLNDMGGGIWEVILPLTDGEYEYKFTYDDWTGQDTFNQGDVCTITNYGNHNRRLVVAGADQTLPTAPFNDCYEDTDGIDGPHNVTFIVDVSGYAGGFLGSGVTINGEWNGWCGNCNPLADQGGDIWSVTLPLDEKAFQFKFTMGAWDDQEFFTPGDIQTATDGANTNRYIQVDGDKTVSYVWEQPEALGNSDFELATFKLFPNPTQDNWNIKSNNREITSIQVYDVLGKSVKSIKPNAFEAVIDASTFTKGLYFAKIDSDSGSQILKLVKR
ncbi:MAG TPA: T9SS type A sorting domain-containing protein [Flavobacteriaceae bacterium]|nr:T9SS type A sorting domain-containing protein [Flavobacteriaceae bacterium]